MTTRSSYGYLTVEPTRQMSTPEVILFENYCQNTKPDPVPYFGPPKWSVQWEEKLRKAPEVYRYPNTRIFLQHSVGYMEDSLHTKNRLDPSGRFDKTTEL